MVGYDLGAGLTQPQILMLVDCTHTQMCSCCENVTFFLPPGHMPRMLGICLDFQDSSLCEVKTVKPGAQTKLGVPNWAVRPGQPDCSMFPRKTLPVPVV